MNQMNDKQKKISKWIALGIAVVTIGIMAPFIFLMMQSVLALIVTLVLGLATINLAPWLAIKMSTWSLKLIKADAMSNPVETRQTIELKWESELALGLAEIEKFQAAVVGFGRKVEQSAQRYPTKTGDYKEYHAGMKSLLELRQAKWQEARNLLGEYKEETVEISFLWDMSQQASSLKKMSGKLSGEDPMQKLRSRIANDSVYNSMDQAMAQLTTALIEESPAANRVIDITPDALTNDPSATMKLTEREYAIPNHR